MGPAPEFANNGHLLTADRKFPGVLSVASGVLEFVADEGQACPPVQVPAADILQMRRNTSTYIFSIFACNNIQYSFELSPKAADTLATVLLALKPAIEVRHSTFLPQLPVVSGPISLEMGAGLTVDGTVTLEHRRFRFVPSWMARLLSNATYIVPLSQVAQPRRLGDGSRIEFCVSGDTRVMVGVGAQHAWLGIRLLQAALLPKEEVQPLAIREDRRGAVAEEALLGLTAGHIGAARAAPVGAAPLSFWCAIEELEAIESHGRESMVVVKGRARYPVRGLGADAWISAVRIRWMSVVPTPPATEDSQSTAALLVSATRTPFGHLEVSTSGLIFHPLQGEIVDLALPGDEVVVRLDPEHVHNLRVEVNLAHHNLLLLDAAEMAREIAVTVSTPTWTLGQADLGDNPLTVEEVAQLMGHAYYTRLFINDVLVAAATDRVVSPQVRDLQCALLVVAERPQFPCLAQLEVASAKGRFLVRVQVLRIGEEAPQANGAPSVRPVRFLLRLMGHVVLHDRRGMNRMKTNEPIDIHWIVAGIYMFVKEDVRMVNLSVSGCALEASEAPDDGTVCQLFAVRSDARPDDPPFDVHGVVTSVSQANDKKFRVGMTFVLPPSASKKVKTGGPPVELAGTMLYHDREQRHLKDLADQRALDEERRREQDRERNNPTE